MPHSDSWKSKRERNFLINSKRLGNWTTLWGGWAESLPKMSSSASSISCLLNLCSINFGWIHFWLEIPLILWRKTEKSTFEADISTYQDCHPDGMKTEVKLLDMHMVVSRELTRVNEFLPFEIFRKISCCLFFCNKKKNKWNFFCEKLEVNSSQKNWT